MNANEVFGNRALELFGPHRNEWVNIRQSTNDGTQDRDLLRRI
jgi:aspartate ammonia-lyase